MGKSLLKKTCVQQTLGDKLSARTQIVKGIPFIYLDIAANLCACLSISVGNSKILQTSQTVKTEDHTITLLVIFFMFWHWEFLPS